MAQTDLYIYQRIYEMILIGHLASLTRLAYFAILIIGDDLMSLNIIRKVAYTNGHSKKDGS